MCPPARAWQQKLPDTSISDILWGGDGKNYPITFRAGLV